MTIVAAGAISSIVPDLYVQIIPPAIASLNGVPTNVVGLVGTAAWGPVNSPTPISSGADYARQFGGYSARKFDAGTVLATMIQQGANNFRVVRVTDSTDTAATAALQVSGLNVTSKYTGSGANGDTVNIGPGSAATSFKVVISRPGQTPETFDNLATGLNGNPVWVAIAAGINAGISGLRGPSQYVVASAGALVAAPAPASVTLAGGTDGAGVAAAALMGADTGTRTGMYALRGTGAAIGVLADCDSSATWTAQVAYGLAEGTYMIAVGPAGEYTAPATVAANKVTAGIDSYALKLLVGDWCYWLDPVNGLRLVSPQGFVAGLLANLGPHQSGLNKPVYGVVATQKTFSNQVYGAADLTIFGQAGLDLITNPVPGGSYFGPRFGRNTSSNAAINQDNYPRLTAYLSQTINSSAGKVVGTLQSPDQRRQAKSILSAPLDGLWSRGWIGNAQGTQPYAIVLDDTNNPSSQVALGIEQANVSVTYLSVTATFLVNLTGGQTVVTLSGNPVAA